jgi:hypothetical protein
MATLVRYQGSGSTPETIKVKEAPNVVALSVNRALKKTCRISPCMRPIPRKP